MPSETTTRVAIALFQTVFIGLSIWLGVTRYVLEADSVDIRSEAVSIAFGYMMLNSALLRITDYFRKITTSDAILDGIQYIRIFSFAIAVGILGWIVEDAWETSGFKEWSLRFILLLIGAVILYVMNLLALQMI